MKTLLRTFIAAALVFSAAPAFAQTAAPRVLLDIGAAMVGGGKAGSVDAVYTSPTGNTVPLFSTSQSWGPGAGAIVHLQIRLKSRLALELSGDFTRPEARASITGDFEAADNVTAIQRVSQFRTNAGLVLSFQQRGKWTPFVRGTIGWLRHLSNDQTLYQDGVTADLGGGVLYTWRQKSGHFKPYGIRADVFVNARNGGLELGPKSRIIAPGGALSFIFKF